MGCSIHLGAKANHPPSTLVTLNVILPSAVQSMSEWIVIHVGSLEGFVFSGPLTNLALPQYS